MGSATATKGELVEANGTPQPISIVPAARMKEVRQLSATAKAASREILACGDDNETKAFVIAHGIQAIRSALTDAIMGDIMALANTPLGFKTDRAPGSKNRKGEDVKPYPVPVVRDVITQALIRGFRITGNEINIIAGNLYVTKEGFARALSEFPGLTDLKAQIGVPKKTGDGALVPCKATWNLHGVTDALVCEGDYSIPVRVNEAMGIDAIQGKAMSKLLRRIYERLVGSQLSVPSTDEVTTEGSDDAQS